MSTAVTTEKPMSFIPNSQDRRLIRMTAAQADINMSETIRRIVRKFFADRGLHNPDEASLTQILAAVQELNTISELTSE